MMAVEPDIDDVLGNSSDLGDRLEWILRLLFSPARGKYGVAIIGNTRLVKGCFLLDRKLKSEFDVETDFDFYAADYGPFDPSIYDSIELLIERKLITAESSERYNGTKFELTPKGRDIAKSLHSDVSREEQHLISSLKSNRILKPLSELLDYVYEEYPEMAKNSRLQD